jgi:tRNA A37 threonylcarbamoyladenosine biosynthesis protein TsaE
VRSPSYNIMKRYCSGRLVLVHADLYRMRSVAEIEELGLFEILPPDGVLAVEWPGRYLPPAAELPTVAINMSMPPAVPGQPNEQSNLRRLELNWDESCPKEVQEVLRALAAR